jgi:Response regulator receiver domain
MYAIDLRCVRCRSYNRRVFSSFALDQHAKSGYYYLSPIWAGILVWCNPIHLTGFGAPGARAFRMGAGRAVMNSVQCPTILIVDDEPGVRSLLKSCLSNNGFHVVGRENGREALEYIENSGHCIPDVVVTDVQMPEMDGVTLATWLVKKYPKSGSC